MRVAVRAIRAVVYVNVEFLIHFFFIDDDSRPMTATIYEDTLATTTINKIVRGTCPEESSHRRPVSTVLGSP